MLENKVIIVAGGEGLLGREMVKAIEAKGGVAISADVSHQTDWGKNKVYFDITDEQCIKDAYDGIVKHYGRIDGLVNNAYPRTADWGAKFEDIDFESWSKNVAFQLNSVFSCIRLAIPYLTESKGAVVNMGSIYGVLGNDFTVYENTPLGTAAPYSAIKGGVINFTRYLASYYGPKGIRFNVVSPGGIFDKQHPTFVKQYEKKVPLKRMGRPDDISPVVAFLLSEESKYITGQNLIVDGGWTIV